MCRHAVNRSTTQDRQQNHHARTVRSVLYLASYRLLAYAQQRLSNITEPSVNAVYGVRKLQKLKMTNLACQELKIKP